MKQIEERHPNQPEYHQAVKEFVNDVIPVVNATEEYCDQAVLERLTEPDRVISFRVTWQDDAGHIRVNRGYRVQFSQAIGPYKGGLRFHPTVDLSILKFLGFEQIFKNSLTGLPIGGGKGGADFDPKGKSTAEVMRFCQNFMQGLFRHLGPETDVPAGDIGVGAREIGYLYGQYKKLVNQHHGVITGKGLSYGGSELRNEATGYGCVYFAENMLEHAGEELKGKVCLISGSGNVAQFCTQKLIQEGARVITMSDSSGTIVDKDGIDEEKLAWIKDLKNVRRGRIKEYAENFNVEYMEGASPWSVKGDIAFPCATQNELELGDAKRLVKNGVIAVAEGANMPSTIGAIEHFHRHSVLFAPGKASNAGGVATSGLEMAQNSRRMSWSMKKVDQRLKRIMKRIHDKCVRHGTENGSVNYVKGANIAGFTKVADAVIQQGVI